MYSSLWKLEARGIEPRTLDLQALFRQALTHIGEEGLALLCSDECLAVVVEAWSGLPASRKRHVVDAVSDRGAQ